MRMNPKLEINSIISEKLFIFIQDIGQLMFSRKIYFISINLFRTG